jgi:putative ATP-binding cassette transporter
MMFMPQQPYLPLGTLRAAIAYPDEPRSFNGSIVALALRQVHLEHLLSSLDLEARWDKELSLDEQQRLACARMILHAPRWIILDDAMSAIAEEHRPLIMSLFDGPLVGAAVICMSRVSSKNTFYSRTIRLLHVPGEVPSHLALLKRQKQTAPMS